MAKGTGKGAGAEKRGRGAPAGPAYLRPLHGWGPVRFDPELRTAAELVDSDPAAGGLGLADKQPA